jgi:cytochrome P450
VGHARFWGNDAPILDMSVSVALGKITEAELLQTLAEMLFLKLDVMTGAVTWNLVFLASNPDLQETLRAEIMDHKNMSSDKAKQRLREYLLSASSFLQACILESSCLRPAAAFSVPQTAPTPRIVDGYLILEKLAFLIDSSALNIQNLYWGDGREDYHPSQILERGDTTMERNLWRFGFGSCQCMGKDLADLIQWMLLVCLLESYELKLPATGVESKRDEVRFICRPNIKLKCVTIR